MFQPKKELPQNPHCNAQKKQSDLPENSAAVQQFEDRLKGLLKDIPKHHFKWIKSVVIGSGLASASFVPAAMLSTVGFTTAGIATGSMAAGIQSSIDAVSAGSAFAMFQSMGATAALTPPGLVVAGIGAVSAGGYLKLKKRRNMRKWEKENIEKLAELNADLTVLEQNVKKHQQLVES